MMQLYGNIIRIHLLHEVLDFLGPVNCRAVLTDTHIMPTAKRLNESEYTAGSIPFVFGIDLFIIAGAHGSRISDFAERLIRFLIHAHNRKKRIIWQLINISDILHSSDEFRICYAQDAPVFTAVRSKPVFFNNRRIASRLTGSSGMTFISSSSSRIVHLL